MCISDDGYNDGKAGEPADHEYQTDKKALEGTEHSPKAHLSGVFAPLPVPRMARTAASDCIKDGIFIDPAFRCGKICIVGFFLSGVV